LSEPTLQEPFFLVEINVPSDMVGEVYEVMATRRGTIEEET
jgi:translation elongation factor EF-G